MSPKGQILFRLGNVTYLLDVTSKQPTATPTVINDPDECNGLENLLKSDALMFRNADEHIGFWLLVSIVQVPGMPLSQNSPAFHPYSSTM